MPLYDYECLRHGSFEVVKFMNDETKELCPQCNRAARRLVSVFAIRRRETPMGTTRQELFDNLALEGNGNKDWRDSDSYYHRAKGIES